MTHCRLVIGDGALTLALEGGPSRRLAELPDLGKLRDWLRFSGERVRRPVVDMKAGETIGAHYADWCARGRALDDEDLEMAHALVSHDFVRTHWPLQSYGLVDAFFLVGVDPAGRGQLSIGEETYELDVDEMLASWAAVLG